jgi:hypothetical protein
MRFGIIGLVVLSCIAFVPAVQAGDSAGCGLGSKVFEGQSGMFPNILAVTTNSTSGNQTFGISSGTLGCNGNDTVQRDAAQREFVAVNYDNLSEEMAQGGGAYVEALGSLMGCSSAVNPAFAEFSQRHYGTLFAATETTPTAFLEGLKQGMANDAQLSASCAYIS